MSKIDDYIKKRGEANPEFANLIEQENISLDVAMKVKDLRQSMDMTQREFAALIGKPQSTIARIEMGSMNVSVMVLSEIAQATNQKLSIEFIPKSN